jgi:RNA polymerase sigma-70 factor (ECF subfamily)
VRGAGRLLQNSGAMRPLTDWMLLSTAAHAEPPTEVQSRGPSRGDAVPSFEQIFVDDAPYIWRALRRLGVRPDDVEDVCQEVFMIVHRRLPSFEGRSAVRTWIYGICIRAVADYRKRAHRRYESASDDLPERAGPANPHAELEEHEARALLDATLRALDDEKRAVFVLFELEELPMTEVAEAVGCPLKTAYSRLYAARRVVEVAVRRAMTGRRVK